MIKDVEHRRSRNDDIDELGSLAKRKKMEAFYRRLKG